MNTERKGDHSFLYEGKLRGRKKRKKRKTSPEVVPDHAFLSFLYFYPLQFFLWVVPTTPQYVN